MNGTVGSEPPLPGVGVDNAADSAYVKSIKPKITKSVNGAGESPGVPTITESTDRHK